MWWFVAIVVVALVTACALIPRKRTQNNAQSQDFTTPTVEEGIPMVVVFGTRLIKAPQVVWFGDVRRDPIKKKTSKKG